MHGMISTAPSLLLTNAILVLSNEVIQGTVQIVNGEIAAMDSGSTSVANAIDCHGDLLMPGLVELHTDNLEKHAVPRPEVRWPTVAAVLAHDAELAAAGITTALNAVTVGSFLEDSLRDQRIDDCIDAIAWAQAERLTKVDHYFHFCCEISAPNALDLLNKHGDTNRLRLVSVMDHTPVSVSGRISTPIGCGCENAKDSMIIRSICAFNSAVSINSAMRSHTHVPYAPGRGSGAYRWRVTTMPALSTPSTRL